jgi:hypothetical protein
VWGGVDRKVQEVVFIFFRGISFSMFGCISLLVLIVKVTLSKADVRFQLFHAGHV